MKGHSKANADADIEVERFEPICSVRSPRGAGAMGELPQQTANQVPVDDVPNWRDGSVAGAYGQARLYRSSRCYNAQTLKRYGIKTVIDLSPSKGSAEKLVFDDWQGPTTGSGHYWNEGRLESGGYDDRWGFADGIPQRSQCGAGEFLSPIPDHKLQTDEFSDKAREGNTVEYHRINIYTTSIKLMLFTKLPLGLALYAALCPCCGVQDPDSKTGETMDDINTIEGMMAYQLGNRHGKTWGSGLVVGTLAFLVAFTVLLPVAFLGYIICFALGADEDLTVLIGVLFWVLLSFLAAYWAFNRTLRYQDWHGFISMYKIFLENSMPQLAPALAVLGDKNRLPALVHCVHGKDRTGVFTAITQLLAGAPVHAVSDNYELSFDLLSGARDTVVDGETHHLTAKIAHRIASPKQMFLLKDVVISSPGWVMQELIQWMIDSVDRSLNSPLSGCSYVCDTTISDKNYFGGRLPLPDGHELDPRARSGKRVTAQHCVVLLLQAAGLSHIQMYDILLNMQCPLALGVAALSKPPNEHNLIRRVATGDGAAAPEVAMDDLQKAHFTLSALSEGYRCLPDIWADIRHGRIERDEMQERLRVYTMASRNQLIEYAHKQGDLRAEHVPSAM